MAAAESVTPAESAVLVRPQRTRWVCVALAVLLVAVSLVAALLLRRSQTGAIFTVSDQVGMVGIGVVLAVAVLFLARPRVRADAEGIEVRNVLLGKRFAWAEVHSVSFPDGAYWARLELAHDEYYSVMAVQSLDRDRAVAAVRALRRLHRAALSTPSTVDTDGPAD